MKEERSDITDAAGNCAVPGTTRRIAAAARPKRATLSIKDVMRECDVSRMTVWRWREHERLFFVRGRISRERLAKWLAARGGWRPGKMVGQDTAAGRKAGTSD